MSDATDTQPSRRLYTGWRIVGANSVVWSLQSMIWVQGYGNMAVELRDQFGWSKSFLSFVYAGARAESIARTIEVCARRHGLDASAPPLSSDAFRRPAIDGQLPLFE